MQPEPTHLSIRDVPIPHFKTLSSRISFYVHKFSQCIGRVPFKGQKRRITKSSDVCHQAAHCCHQWWLLQAVMLTGKSFQRDSAAKACISKPEHPSIRCDRSCEDHDANSASFKHQRKFLVSERLRQCFFYGFIGVGRDTEQAGLLAFLLSNYAGTTCTLLAPWWRSVGSS